MMGKFEVYIDKEGGYRFRLKAGNNEIILASEGYGSKASAMNGIRSVKENAPYDVRYERKEAVDGRWFFNLLAANYEPIGTSQMYKSQSSRDNGIASVKENAPGAEIVDLT